MDFKNSFRDIQYSVFVNASKEGKDFTLYRLTILKYTIVIGLVSIPFVAVLRNILFGQTKIALFSATTELLLFVAYIFLNLRILPFQEPLLLRAFL
ncbi:hypothetical protein [Desulfurobacterium sp.]|uniref:hypothetical protein n=1 Tax=Desulfurobacterium sp. TaxID=2004706 RepID=UPI0026041D69|nr:hypothetical protein [Desulfurobacterium sp.]